MAGLAALATGFGGLFAVIGEIARIVLAAAAAIAVGFLAPPTAPPQPKDDIEANQVSEKERIILFCIRA
ncbi:hypothetical protein ABIC44_001751 [Sphingomonas sp. 1185]